MKQYIRWLVVMALCLFPLILTACGGAIPVTAEENKPITVEHLQDEMAPTRETLTEAAAKRLDIQTSMVGMDGNQGVIPFSALLYDNDGNTWVYTNPESLTFVRNSVVVDHIQGDRVYLKSSLPADTKVVTTGAVELYGSEEEFEEE